jgi:hypothetical protein
VNGANPVTNLHDQEPALVMGLLTFVGGFLAQVGPAGIGSLRSLGTCGVASGLQAVLARERVVSPATARNVSAQPLAADEIDSGITAPGAPLNSEPALVMALVAAIGSFLLQLVGGHHVDLLQALGTSGGIAGVQGLLTRQRVSAPATIAQSRWQQTLTDLEGQITGG